MADRNPVYKNRIRPSGVKYWYDGSLYWPDLSPELKRAYRCWTNQVNRCENPNIPGYQYYVAKGIEVKYSSREFIGWWLEEIKIFQGDRPTISRVDHDGHYEFGNIKIEDHLENCVIETSRRCGPPSKNLKKKILIMDAETGEKLMIVSSGKESAMLTGVAGSQISAVAKNKPHHHQAKGYRFAFVE